MGDAAPDLTEYQRGNRHFVAKQYSEASRAFAAHAAAHPEAAADCFERMAACALAANVVAAPRPTEVAGIQLVSQGNVELAEHCLRRALEADPKHFAALLALSDLPGVSPSERAQLLERAMEIQPNYLALLDLGDDYRSRQKDPARAAALYIKAHKVNPRDVAACTKLADLYHRSGDLDQARRWSDEAAALRKKKKKTKGS